MVDAVLADYRSAAVDERTKALFAFVEKVCRDAASIRREDVAEVVGAGWSEEAVYDAVTVCALFQFYNAWIDGTGVHDMPAAAYEASAKRMAANGYAPPDTRP